MPKKTVAARPPDDVPIWDELVTELDDPRPYEPSVIGTIIVTDESCVDDGGFDDVSTDLDDKVDWFRHFADELTLETHRALAAIITDFEVKHGPLLSPTVDRSTACEPALTLIDVETTVVLPAWPTFVDEDVTP